MAETIESEQSSTRRQPRSRIDPYREFVGILTDSEVAAKAGVTPSAVTQYRSRNGIAPALPQGATRRAQLRGKRNKADKRRQASAPEPKPDNMSRADRLVAPHAHLLGVASDLYVAELAGVTVPDVRAFRDRQAVSEPLPPEPLDDLEALLVPVPNPVEARPGDADDEDADDAADADRDEGADDAGEEAEAASRRKAGGAPRRSRIDAHRDLLGVLSDGEVAARAGVTANAVQMFRKKHGIPAAAPGRKWRGPGKANAAVESAPVADRNPPQERAAAPAPVAAAVTRSTGRKMFAWRLSFASDAGVVTRIAVASDAAAACSLANGVGDVIGVERLSEALV